MNIAAAEASVREQDRHAVAGWSRPLSLRTRLSLLVGFIVAAVVGTAAFLELRTFAKTLERELVDAARITAIAVADDFELRARTEAEAQSRDVLHQFLEVNGAVRSITIIGVGPAGPVTVASTSSGERASAIEAARKAAVSGDEISDSDGSMRFVAVPAVGPFPQMAVVVTVSTAMLDRMERRGGLIALWVMVPAVLLVTVLLDLLARRLVHRRIGGLRQTMQRVAAGNLTARATVDRADEIGDIAVGLNAMLAEMEGLSDSLQMRVRDATAELRARSSEVEEMYKRIFDLREALSHAERMAAVGQAAANVAHQVGTPLNLVSGYVQMLLADPAPDTRTRRRLEMMQRQIEQVAGAVRGLLDRARRPIPRERSAPAPLMNRVLEIAQPRLERNRVVVSVKNEPDLPFIEADVVQLELALLNLVTNALDAMGDHGTLSVSLLRSPRGVRIDVADSGPGVPDALLPTIFEPWVTTKPFGRGTGLGLAIARGVIAGHGGTIQVVNRPEGGAVFSVDLPAAPEPSEPKEPSV